MSGCQSPWDVAEGAQQCLAPWQRGRWSSGEELGCQNWLLDNLHKMRHAISAEACFSVGIERQLDWHGYSSIQTSQAAERGQIPNMRVRDDIPATWGGRLIASTDLEGWPDAGAEQPGDALVQGRPACWGGCADN